MRLAPLVAVAAALLPGAIAGTCTSNPLAHCYPSGTTGCQGTTLVDFVFVIDISWSMGDKIQAVVNNLQSFVDNINNNSALDAQYGVVTFGYAYNLDPVIPTLPTPQPTVYSSRRSGANVKSDLQYFVTRCDGSIENGMVAIQTAANQYNWRSNSLKTIFLLTDEDSDPNFKLIKSQFNAYYYPDTYNAVPAANPFVPDWQSEIDNAAAALISKNISIYMSVKVNNGTNGNGALLTPIQYGEPSLQSQNSSFGNFSPSTTLNTLKSKYFTKDCRYNCITSTSSSLAVSLASSVQGQVLAAQVKGMALTARVYDLALLSSTNNFFSNIFSVIKTNIADCDKCYSYTCGADGSCATPTYTCDCAGTPYGTATLDCAGVCGGTSKIDVCTGVCRVNATTNTEVCRCPTLKYDPCGNCITTGWNSTATQFCIQNCNGKWVNATDLNTFNDDCGVKCGNNTAKDLCGVCYGNNTKVVYANDGPCPCFTSPVTCPSGYTMCNIPDNAHLSDGSINYTAICPSTSGCDLTANNFVCGQCYAKTTDNATIYDNCGYCKNLNAVCVQDCFGVYGGSAKTDQCGTCLQPGSVNPFCVQDCTGNYSINSTLVVDPCTYKCVNASDAKSNCTTVVVTPKTPNNPDNTNTIIGASVGGGAAVVMLASLLIYLRRSGVLGSASKQVDMGASTQNPIYSDPTQVQNNPLYNAN